VVEGTDTHPEQKRITYFGTTERFLESDHGGFRVEAIEGDELTVMKALAQSLKAEITDVLLYRVDAIVKLAAEIKAVK